MFTFFFIFQENAVTFDFEHFAYFHRVYIKFENLTRSVYRLCLIKCKKLKSIITVDLILIESLTM